jgi:hypothetical protein
MMGILAKLGRRLLAQQVIFVAKRAGFQPILQNQDGRVEFLELSSLSAT